MVLVAIGLGVLFGWLHEVWCRRLHQQLRPAGARVGLLPRLFSTLAFLVVAALFGYALYAQYVENWTHWTVRLFDFVTAPAQLWCIIGFLAGWLGYRYRTALFGTSPRAHATENADAGMGDELVPPQQNKAGQASGLLGKLTGLPLLGALAFVVVLSILGPELRARLESFRFGDIEARFAAAKQSSLRTTLAQFAPGPPMGGSTSALKKQFEMNSRVREVIVNHLVLSDANRAATRAADARAAAFHDAVVFPLADAMACYMSTYTQPEAQLRSKSIKLALGWKDFSTKLAGDPAQDAVQAAEFAKRVNETFVLAQDYARAARELPSCRGATVPEQAPNPAQFQGSLAELFSNGFVITFVGNLIASTHDRAQEVEYLDAMAGRLDQSTVASAGQIRFYLERTTAKGYAGWYPRNADGDLQQARAISDELVKTVTPSAGAYERLVLYVGQQRAFILNMEVFSSVHDWHEGYRLSPHQMARLEEGMGELRKWIRQFSPKALGRDPDEVVVAPTINLIATAYDTLAMAEIVVGESKSDRSKDSCARIADDLATAQDLYQWWAQVRVRRGKDQLSDYRTVFRTIDAHHVLYTSFCNA